jgi:Spatacsin C-terminus
VDDFSSLARLVTGVISTLSFILDIVIENGQLELLLENYSAAAETATGSVAAVRGFRMTVFTSLKRYNPHGLMALIICNFSCTCHLLVVLSFTSALICTNVENWWALPCHRICRK